MSSVHITSPKGYHMQVFSLKLMETRVENVNIEYAVIICNDCVLRTLFWRSGNLARKSRLP